MGCPANYAALAVHRGKTQSFGSEFPALLSGLIVVPNEEHFENG